MPSTMRFSRNATCFFSPRGCCTIVTNSPSSALPSDSISRLKPNGASCLGRRPHRHDCEIQTLIGEEEPIGIEAECGDFEQFAVDAVLVVELDVARRGGLCGVEDVMVGQHQVWRDHRPGAVSEESSVAVLDEDAAHRAGRGHTGIQIPRSDEIRCVDDGFEQLLRRRRVGYRGALDGLFGQPLGRLGGRGRRKLVAGAEAGDAVEAPCDKFGRVELGQVSRGGQRLLVREARFGTFDHPAAESLELLLGKHPSVLLRFATRIALIRVGVLE